MKRSNAPIFWLLFGAGGMLSALLGTMLVFITGLAVPIGWPLPSDLMSYPRMLAFAQHGVGKGFLFVVISLFAWHAVHRIFHSLHDVGIHNGAAAKMACYGSALVITLVVGCGLLALGFDEPQRGVIRVATAGHSGASLAGCSRPEAVLR